MRRRSTTRFRSRPNSSAAPLARYNVAPATDQLVILRRGRAQGGALAPLGADSALGQGQGHRLQDHQCARRKRRGKAGFPRRFAAAPLPGSGDGLLRMEGARRTQATVPDHGSRAAGCSHLPGCGRPGADPRGSCARSPSSPPQPNELMARIHDRMPAIIPRAQYARWLDPALQDPAQIQPMIASYPAGETAGDSGRPAINNARNQGAGADSAGGRAARSSLGAVDRLRVPCAGGRQPRPCANAGWQRLEWRHVAFGS